MRTNKPSLVRRRRLRRASAAVVLSAVALLACQGCGEGSSSGPGTFQHLATASTTPTRPGVPSADPDAPQLTLAQARSMTATWLATYNSVYASINRTGDSKAMTEVTWPNGAAMQEEAIAYGEVGMGSPSAALKAVHWTGTPEYWVPRRQPGLPAYVVRATPEGQDQPTYYLFIVKDGKALLIEDPQAHVNVSQPQPVLDAQGYAKIAPNASCNAISKQYQALWDADSVAASRRAAPSLAPDNYTVKIFPDVWKHSIYARIDSYEAPFGIMLRNDQSMCMIALYNNPKHVIQVISALVTRPADGENIEESAGSWVS